MFQIQTQDALEAAVEADDKDKLQQALQSNQAQVYFRPTIKPKKPFPRPPVWTSNAKELDCVHIQPLAYLEVCNQQYQPCHSAIMLVGGDGTVFFSHIQSYSLYKYGLIAMCA